MIIRVKNNLADENTPKTFLDADMVAGTTKLTVKNTEGLTNDWAVQIGKTAEDKTEITNISSAPSAGTFGVDAISFNHPTDTPVYAVKFDQMIFKRSTAGTAGTATAMTDGTISIAPGNTYTQFDDTGGSASYAYKVSYYSTGLTSESDNSDWLTPSGYAFYSLAKLRERAKAKMTSDVNDDEVDDWLNEWLEIMTNAAIDANKDYAIGTTSVAWSGTAQEGTITADDFKQIRRAWYTENGTDVYMMTKQELTAFQPSEDFNVTHPYFYMKGDSIIGRNPHSQSGTATIDYYKLNAVLDNDTDNLPVPMRGYSQSFIKWAVAQSYRKDNEKDQALVLETSANQDRDRFRTELTPRHKTGADYIEIVEDWGEGDTDVYW